MPQTESWTIGRLLQWTADFLRQHGSQSPRLDAEVLLAHAWGKPRIQLYANYGETASEPLREQFRDLVRQRATGKPVAYLVGYKEFFSLKLEVTPDCLVPRPETELLVVEVLGRIKNDGGSSRPWRVIDVGTGSGAIAVSIASQAPSAQLLAIDISPAALEVARRSARKTHQVAARVELLESDLLSQLPTEADWDFVVSNPPYVAEDEWPELPVDVREHEPRSALVAGPTGTETIARLIPEAVARLKSGGWLMLEIGPRIEAAVRQLLTDADDLHEVNVVKDLAGLPRLACGRKV